MSNDTSTHWNSHCVRGIFWCQMWLQHTEILFVLGEYSNFKCHFNILKISLREGNIIHIIKCPESLTDNFELTVIQCISSRLKDLVWFGTSWPQSGAWQPTKAEFHANQRAKKREPWWTNFSRNPSHTNQTPTLKEEDEGSAREKEKARQDSEEKKISIMRTKSYWKENRKEDGETEAF